MRWDALIWRTVGYWHRRNPSADVDDLRSECVAGWCEAARRFDAGRGYQFSTYARWWADNFAREFCRREVARGVKTAAGRGQEFVAVPVASLSAPGPERSRGTDLAELVGRDNRRGDGQPDFGEDFWQEVTRGLKPRLAEVLLLRFRDGLTLAEVGQRFRLSKERVRQMEREAVAWLRENRPQLEAYLGAA